MKDKIALYEYLSEFISENKRNLFDTIVQDRTRHLTVILEDIFQPHNASAVLRSCDCFGIQDVHVVEKENQYNPNPDVALGSEKWLSLNYHRNTYGQSITTCAEKLKASGYKIVATLPADGAFTPDNIPLDQPLALMMGSELPGLTNEAIAQADYHLKIPMYGFTESFNISVATSLILQRLAGRIRKENIDWSLSNTDQMDIKIQWIGKVVKDIEGIKARFTEQKITNSKSNS